MSSLGSVAQVRIPKGYKFTGAAGTRKLLEGMENPTSGNELGFVAPDSLDWFMIYEFEEIGYVRDDEKGALDADAILKSLRRGNDSANRERKKRGWAPLDIVGWEQPPHYDTTTHNLEWAIRGQSGNESVVNYNTRLLGRRGVMSVTLVADPKNLQVVLPWFRWLLTGFGYNQGSRYAEFVSSDKVAAVGLSALVVGGAAAAAAKGGLFKSLGKLMVAGIAAVVALFQKIFGKKGSDQDETE